MGLVQKKTLDSGVIGDYWRITQRNSNFDRKDDVCTMELYLSHQARLDGAKSLGDSITFHFHPGDHPVDDLDPGKIDVELTSDVTMLEMHIRYMHIKRVSSIAKTKNDLGAELTPNEKLALFFINAEDAL
jgi:hypothetical protein